MYFLLGGGGGGGVECHLIFKGLCANQNALTVNVCLAYQVQHNSFLGFYQKTK